MGESFGRCGSRDSTQAHGDCFGPTARWSPQALLAGRVLGHRQGHRALCSLPHVPGERQMGRGQAKPDPEDSRERKANPRFGIPPPHALTRSQLVPGGCHLGPGPSVLPPLSPLRSLPVKEEQENSIEDIGPQHLSECPQVCLERRPESRSLHGSMRPRSSLIPMDRRLCHPLPGPHLPAATATRPRPVPGLCSCLAHGR